ncbi:hypothetical protein FJTKL_05713 [Diaporthe vaccinii]|uniref:Uncharacterized protein n=1 Tax=Diaporthe vaccinii TaxID=105482 RepID=A0ABR4DR94_9PEZI
MIHEEKEIIQRLDLVRNPQAVLPQDVGWRNGKLHLHAGYEPVRVCYAAYPLTEHSRNACTVLMQSAFAAHRVSSMVDLRRLLR